MEPENLSPCSQNSTVGPYPEPVQQIPSQITSSRLLVLAFLDLHMSLKLFLSLKFFDWHCVYIVHVPTHTTCGTPPVLLDSYTSSDILS
jgi:hypothetical protein